MFFTLRREMNLVAFGLILICCHARAIETDGYTVNENESIFSQFLEKFKEILRTGDVGIGIPQLDPYNKDELQINIEKIIILKGLLNDIVVNGLSNYDINNSSFSDVPPIVTLNLTWPSITANTDYSDLKGIVGYYEIFGDNGDIEISAANLNIVATIKFAFREDPTFIEVAEIDVNLILEKLDCHVRGLFDDEDLSKLMSIVISEIMPQLIKDNRDTISSILNIAAKELLDDFTAKMSLENIVRMIGLL